MKRERLSPQMIGSPLVLVVLASCAIARVAPTPTPIPATRTATRSPTTPTPTPSPETPTRTPLPPPISPEFPTGSFFHEHAGGVFCVFHFSQDGTYAYYWLAPSRDVSSMRPYATGTYSIDGNLFVETSTDLAECSAPATYTWTYDGQTLTFQVVGEDMCSDRQRTYESPLLYARVE
jgi:hypothetical protein